MNAKGTQIRLSPTDLSQFLSCHHLTALSLKVERGEAEKPEHYSPVTEAKRDKGHTHEQAYLAHLKTQYAVVIYSMTSSSPDDAPRAMEFLYNPNRFNLATSRARALCVLAGEPRLLAPVCKTPKQIRMANGFCRFGEMVG